jgi:hypothetical protein
LLSRDGMIGCVMGWELRRYVMMNLCFLAM